MVLLLYREENHRFCNARRCVAGQEIKGKGEINQMPCNYILCFYCEMITTTKKPRMWSLAGGYGDCFYCGRSGGAIKHSRGRKDELNGSERGGDC